MPLAVVSEAADSKAERAAAHIENATVALRQQQYKTAASEYRKAAELSDNVEIAQQATHVGYSYGFNEDALAAAKRWLKLDKESDEALLYQAQLELRLGDLRRSRRDFKKLLERGTEPVDERLMSLIGILSQEDPQDAFEVMEKLAAPYKDSAYAHYAVGVMALQAGDSESAKTRAQRAIDLEQDWLKPQLLYARAMLLGGDTDGAIDYTARLIGDDPDPDPEARLELAIMLLSAERDDDALSQVNQILLEQPGRTDALRLMAIINFRLERLDAAWDDFQDLLASGRYTMDALYYLGRIADRRSEHERAIRLYSQVTHGSNAVLSQRRASGIMSQQGETDAALAHLQNFGRDNPSYAIDMIQAQGQLLASLERYPEALEYYDQVISYRPDSEPAHLGKAELLLRMDRLDDAVDLYRESVRRWPDSATSLNALGYTLADRTDNYKEAARLIEKALAMEPDNAAIIDSHGWVLYRQGDYEQALQQLNRAYELLKDAEVAAHIVEVLWKLDREDEAKEALESAELIFPDSDILRRIRERAFPDG
jgi:tetratricopeptide (TPR) repeat protein